MIKNACFAALVALSFVNSEAAKAELVAMRLDFHVKVDSVEDCVAKVQKSIALGATVSITTVNVVPDAESFCRTLIESPAPASAVAPPLPFLTISLTAPQVPVSVPAPPAEAGDGSSINFFLDLELAGYDDCLAKFTTIDRYSVEVGASQTVNGSSGPAAICRSLFPDLSSIPAAENGGP